MSVRPILLCLLLALATQSFAQKVYRVPNAQRYFLGIKAGILGSLPTFRDPDLKKQFETGVSPGFNVSGLINFSLKKRYSFQSEFGYTMTGRRVTFGSDHWTNASTYQFLDFAMMLRRSFKLKIGKDIPADWFVNIGPNIKYWMAGSGKIEVLGNTSQTYTIAFGGDPKGEYDKLYYFDANRWLFGIDVGVGANLGTFRGQQVMGELRLTWGQTYLGHKNSVTPQSINLVGYEDSLLCNLKMLSFSVAYTIDFYTGQAKMGHSTHDTDKKKKK